MKVDLSALLMHILQSNNSLLQWWILSMEVTVRTEQEWVSLISLVWMVAKTQVIQEHGVNAVARVVTVIRKVFVTIVEEDGMLWWVLQQPMKMLCNKPSSIIQFKQVPLAFLVELSKEQTFSMQIQDLEFHVSSFTSQMDKTTDSQTTFRLFQQQRERKESRSMQWELRATTTIHCWPWLEMQVKFSRVLPMQNF
jgi:hypothetical protein